MGLEPLKSLGGGWDFIDTLNSIITNPQRDPKYEKYSFIIFLDEKIIYEGKAQTLYYRRAYPGSQAPAILNIGTSASISLPADNEVVFKYNQHLFVCDYIEELVKTFFIKVVTDTSLVTNEDIAEALEKAADLLMVDGWCQGMLHMIHQGQ